MVAAQEGAFSVLFSVGVLHWRNPIRSQKARGLMDDLPNNVSLPGCRAGWGRVEGGLNGQMEDIQYKQSTLNVKINFYSFKRSASLNFSFSNQQFLTCFRSNFVSQLPKGAPLFLFLKIIIGNNENR